MSPDELVHIVVCVGEIANVVKDTVENIDCIASHFSKDTCNKEDELHKLSDAKLPQLAKTLAEKTPSTEDDLATVLADAKVTVDISKLKTKDDVCNELHTLADDLSNTLDTIRKKVRELCKVDEDKPNKLYTTIETLITIILKHLVAYCDSIIKGLNSTLDKVDFAKEDVSTADETCGPTAVFA